MSHALALSRRRV